MDKPKPNYQTPEDEFLFASIGRLTISWAVLELGIDVLIIAIHGQLGGTEIEAERPWALKRKLKYLRKCFSKLAVLSPYTKEALTLFDEIATASYMRHDIVHGVATHHPEGATELPMMRLIRGSHLKAAKFYKIETIEILRAAVEANNLGGRAGILANNIIEATGISQIK